MLDVLLQGILLGGVYSLFAIGLSLMFGVMRLTNIAQGDLIILAAYGVMAATAGLAVHAGVAVAIALPSAYGLGYATQTWLLNGTLGRDPLPSMVVTFGLSIIIQNGLQQIFAVDPRSIAIGDFAYEGFDLPGDVRIGALPTLILLVAVACTAGLQWLFRSTSLGRAFRAVSDDRETAELMGLDAKRVYATATGIAFAVTALAGSLQGMRSTVSPGDGPQLLLFAFEAVIIGGLGSFWGTFAGALLLGIVQQVGSTFDPSWGIWFGHLVFVAALVVRPRGLFPKTLG